MNSKIGYISINDYHLHLVLTFGYGKNKGCRGPENYFEAFFGLRVERTRYIGDYGADLVKLSDEG
jgi:hypothetical protein